MGIADAHQDPGRRDSARVRQPRRVATHRALLLATAAARRADEALRQQRSIEPPAAERDREVWERYMARISPRDRLVHTVAVARREQMLTAARLGHTSQAERGLAALQRVLGSAGLGPAAMLLARTLDAAAESYVSFRAGRFDVAREQMHDALAATNLLLDEYAFSGIHERRLHLAANLVRLDASAAPTHAASVAAGCGLLRYINGSNDCWPYPGFAVRTPLSVARDEALGEASIQLVRQMAHSLDNCAGDRDSLAAVLNAQAAPAVNGACALRRWANSWVDYKRCQAARHDEACIEVGLDLLAQGRTPAPVLWDAVYQELLAGGEPARSPDSNWPARSER